MGALLGLLAGIGLLLVLQARTRPAPAKRRSAHLAEQLAQAGVTGVTPRQLVSSAAGLGLVTTMVVLGLSRVPLIALAFGGFAGALPFLLLRRRRARRQAELRQLWPDVVDNLASAVRAGLSLPEAVSQLASRGPEALRPDFAAFAAEYTATARFDEALALLKDRLADPVGDRVVEALRMAREVGGTDLGRLLRTLSAFLREDARTRAELETRQSWTVNGARLALAAPWVILLLLATRPVAVAAYNTSTGSVVLLAGGGISVLSYRLMLRIARLPAERRVLQ